MSPALLTSTSTRGQRSRISAAALRTSASEYRSAITSSPAPPSAASAFPRLRTPPPHLHALRGKRAGRLEPDPRARPRDHHGTGHGPSLPLNGRFPTLSFTH